MSNQKTNTCTKTLCNDGSLLQSSKSTEFKSSVKQIALANGFKLKEQPDGTMDLNPYVYDFAAALISYLRVLKEN